MHGYLNILFLVKLADLWTYSMRKATVYDSPFTASMFGIGEQPFLDSEWLPNGLLLSMSTWMSWY